MFQAEGGCDCRQIRYRLRARPLFVHACHCRWCQRESGSSFALNAMIETERLELLQGRPDAVLTPSESGRGQRILRCPQCRLALWSHYAGSGPAVAFVRVGSLDDPDACPPDVHIFTASKQAWLSLPPDARSFAEFYSPEERLQMWSPESLRRREQLLPQLRAWTERVQQGEGWPD